jgi:hypothetical protein
MYNQPQTRKKFWSRFIYALPSLLIKPSLWKEERDGINTESEHNEQIAE